MDMDVSDQKERECPMVGGWDIDNLGVLTSSISWLMHGVWEWMDKPGYGYLSITVTG